MIEHPSCPSCSKIDWKPLQSRTFRLSDKDRLSAYVRKRYQVLFEIWQPGKSELTVTFQACRGCGIVIFAPRPSAKNLDAKYAFLAGLNASEPEPLGLTASDVWRARRLQKELQPVLRKGRPSRILDFGGGDGRLMAALLAEGHQCAVIDWCDKPIGGVSWLGATLNSVSRNERFDVVVASHVIEHVAEPRAVLLQLRELLAPGGSIYVEVPLEIWGRLPAMTEPVTHVNFFIPASLRQLLENSGYRVQVCRTGTMRYGDRWESVIRALGTEDSTPRVVVSADPIVALDRFLNPTVAMRLRQRLSNPGSWLEVLRYRLLRLIGSK